MPMRDEYAELARNAKDALHALLKESEPGTGMPLHTAYTMLKRMLQEGEQLDLQAEQRAIEREQIRARNELEKQRRLEYAARQWKNRAMHVRERQVLEALGDERLTTKEVTAIVKTANPDHDVYPGSVNSVLQRLVYAREVDRVAEQWKNRKRYRYFRRTTLEGPIADLQRSLDEGS